MSGSGATLRSSATIRHSPGGRLRLSSSQEHYHYVIQCQLAHGSPTGLLTDIQSIGDLYEKIADCYDISPNDILYCTLNTRKLNMTKLLGSLLAPTDFIFAHVRGQKKEVELQKEEDPLGLTITDNGLGRCFVKRIKRGAALDRISNGYVRVGDHIERINNDMMLGKRHYEVARRLKEIPVGSTFTIKLVEPLAPEAFQPPNDVKLDTSCKPCSVKRNQTIRLKARSRAVVETIKPAEEKIIERLNEVLDSYLGISDYELARCIRELSQDCETCDDLARKMNDNPELSCFQMPSDVIADFWYAAVDADTTLSPSTTLPASSVNGVMPLEMNN